MVLNDYVQQAVSILIEEQAQPTIRYRHVQYATLKGQRVAVEGLDAWAEQKSAQDYLKSQRNHRPRKVEEDPKSFAFESMNFNLLVKVFSLVPEADREKFIHALLHYVRNPMPAADYHGEAFPSFGGKTSALALLAQFCVRTGHLHQLLSASTEAKVPTYGLAIMVRDLEDMRALNFNLFSDAELAALPGRLGTLRDVADKQTHSERGPRGGTMTKNPYYKRGRETESNEIVAAIDGITEQCRKARYFYLRGALQELPNLEIESDKVKVVGFLDSLGFDPLLAASLTRAERQYSSASGPFDWKDCLGHIRSFYEHMNIDAGQALAKSLETGCVDKWDPTLTFLKNKGFFTEQQDKFARGLYTLLSDEGVHPLIAEKEFARLLRNMVIEYGLMFLTMLEKKGIRI